MISIIIPVYNSEKYIKECLDSLIIQTFSEFEIICVDDGSTDNSYNILQQYKEKDNRISVFKQKNQYAGAARNYGIKKAKGKYLLFLDADDFFCKTLLEELWEKAESRQTEILIFDAHLYDNELKKVVNTEWKAITTDTLEENIYSSKAISEVVFNFTISAPWNKLFLREFILRNDLWFQCIQRTNDLYFVYASLSYADRISIYNKKLVYYRVNNKLSLQGSTQETPDVFIYALEELKKNLEIRQVWDIFKESYKKMAVNVCIYNLSNMHKKENFCKLTHILKNKIDNILELSKNNVNTSLLISIEKKEKIIVYGAGVIAKCFVRILLYHFNYKKSDIIIVVTDNKESMKAIEDIPINNIMELEIESKKDNIFIAVSNEKAQKSIVSLLNDLGCNRKEIISFEQIASLLKSINI